MDNTSNGSLNEQINPVLEALYPGLMRRAPGIASRVDVHNPRETGEDTVNTWIMRLLAMKDEQKKREFLERTPGGQLAYGIVATYRNVLQELRWEGRLEPLPEEGVGDLASNPAEEAEAQDARAKAMQILSGRPREVIELDMLGFSAEEIAEELRMEPNNVRQQRFKAINKMRMFWQDKDITP